MKRRKVAVEVLNNLASTSDLNQEVLSQALRLFETGDAGTAFKLAARQMAERSWSLGWNKVWSVEGIYGWYGSLTTFQPLRAAVLEAARNPSNGYTVRQFLQSIWGSELPPPSGRVAITLLQRYLTGLGFNISGNKLGIWELTFLRRMNLDTREQPYFERLHWTGATGTAILSDGGRFQINAEMVWARALEVGLSENGTLTGPVASFLKRVTLDSREVELPDGGITEELSAMIDILKFYRFADLTSDRIIFNAEIGVFPSIASELWEDN